MSEHGKLLVMAEEPARRFLVRTFGCQMNEHDSERISGCNRRAGASVYDAPGG